MAQRVVEEIDKLLEEASQSVTLSRTRLITIKEILILFDLSITQLSDAYAKLLRAHQEVDHLNANEINRHNKEIAELKVRIQKLTKENNDLKDDIENIDVNNDTLINTVIQKLHISFTSVFNIHLTQIQGYPSDIQKINTQKNSLVTQLQNLKAQLNNLLTDTSNLTNQKSILDYNRNCLNEERKKFFKDKKNYFQNTKNFIDDKKKFLVDKEIALDERFDQLKAVFIRKINPCLNSQEILIAKLELIKENFENLTKIIIRSFTNLFGLLSGNKKIILKRIKNIQQQIHIFPCQGCEFLSWILSSFDFYFEKYFSLILIVFFAFLMFLCFCA